MKRALGYLVLVAACGPLLVPMAGRLGEAEQRRVDEGWSRALAPVDRLSHDEWLDLFVGASVFEEGVDKLSFRSEKAFSGGVVVMRVEYDRARPSADRFTMEVHDPRGAIVRREEYARDEVTRTARALFANEANDDAATRAAREKRWAKIREYFPRPGSIDASID